MSATISFIVPIYNKEKTIEKCITSILEQTYNDIELILVDDGSSDNSYEKCKVYAELNSKIKLFQQTNKGVSAARNLGIEKATGLFLSFVDADDYLKQDFAEQMLACAGEDVDVIACTCCAIIDGESIPQHFFPGSFYTGVSPEKKAEIFYQLMDTSYAQYKPVYTGIGVPWGKLIKTSIIREQGFRFNTYLDHYEDNLFIMELYYSTDKFIFLDQCLYYYSTTHISGLLSRYSEKVVNSYIRLYKLRKNLIDRHPNETSKEMVRRFMLASLDLFDVAAFTMTICLCKDNIFQKRTTLKKIVEGTGYLELFRSDIKDLSLTHRRRMLYRMLGCKLYFIVVIMILIRNIGEKND